MEEKAKSAIDVYDPHGPGSNMCENMAYWSFGLKSRGFGVSNLEVTEKLPQG